MSTFGDLERAFADLYPYRWAFAAGIIVFLAVLTGYAYRQGWHTILLRRRVKASMIATPALVVTSWLECSLYQHHSRRSFSILRQRHHAALYGDRRRLSSYGRHGQSRVSGSVWRRCR